MESHVSDTEVIAAALAARPLPPAKSVPQPDSRLEERRRHDQKMDALGQITGGIAHDFNNLLLAINFNLESLAVEVPAGPTTTPLFEGARQAIEQAHDLIGHLLIFARCQPLSPTSIDVNRSVLETQPMLLRAMPVGVEIERRLGHDIGLVLADRNQFETALLNLVLNARDAMPGGGRLTIGTADITFDAAYAALRPGVMPGRFVLLAVSDTGAGMAPDVVERAFEPYFTTKNSAEHSGLGLSQVYGCAKQSGGYARIDSEPGRGTTVQLFLPRFADLVLVQHRSPSSNRARGKTVLLVEDAPLACNAIAEMLADLGYRPIAVPAAEQAMRLIESDSRIDLLLTDLVLPGGLDGEQLAIAARRAWPGLGVLYMSGYADRLGSNAEAEGRSGFIAKPFSKADLAAVLRSILDGEAVIA
jgi:nitrogen-specific signal transduction histidine kinase/CheY-like chemotaxis protein